MSLNCNYRLWLMNLDKLIIQVELKWLKTAESFFNSCFENIWLPSHDFEHHLRVWDYAKEQVFGFERKGVSFDYDFIESLCIAALMHDVGLSRTFDESHGKESAELTKTFLNANPTSSSRLREEMLEAICLHDDKSYLNKKASQVHPSIYQILTVADDMDAFGYLGVFRYFEIYERRGISAKEMVPSIIKNINKRFEFVGSRLKDFPIVYKAQKERFENSMEILSNISVFQIEELLGYFEKHQGLEDLMLITLDDELKDWIRLAIG